MYKNREYFKATSSSPPSHFLQRKSRESLTVVLQHKYCKTVCSSDNSFWIFSKKKKIIILYYISLSGMLEYEALGANFSSWEFDSAVASWGNGEIGEGRVLTQLKSNPLFSLTKLENMFSRFPSSLIFCFLWSQISVSASLYNCTASGCHIVYRLGRVQPRSGSPAGSPREAQCCRNALCASSTSGTALTFHHFAIQRSNPR